MLCPNLRMLHVFLDFSSFSLDCFGYEEDNSPSLFIVHMYIYIYQSMSSINEQLLENLFVAIEYALAGPQNILSV